MTSHSAVSYLLHVFNPILLFGAAGTLALMSLVFKENKLYRLFEHIFLGLALGFDLEQNWTQVLGPQLWDPIAHQGEWAWAMIVPVGLLFYAPYVKPVAWMSRLIYGVLFGFAAGTVFQDFCQRLVPQVVKSFDHSLIPPPPAPRQPGVPYEPLLHSVSFVLNNFLFIGILVCVVTYFFFAFEQKNAIVRAAARMGRLVLMFAFGAMFGSTIMTRMALLIDRMYFLLHDWLRIVPK